jgi:hypothetical protein
MAVPSAIVGRRHYGPGKLFLAPPGTITDTYAPIGANSKFTLGTTVATNVPGNANWLPAGITTDGMTFTGNFTTENDEAAEYATPIKVLVTGQAETLAVTLKQVNLTNIRAALNAGTSSVTRVSGATGATGPGVADVVRIRKPAIGTEQRCQLLWLAQDDDFILLIYSALQTGDFTIQGQKGAGGITLPLTFTVEQPPSTVAASSYDMYAIGTSWAESQSAE